MLSYDEALEENFTVCMKVVKSEIELHGCDISEFFADVGKKESYTTQELLGWLGY